MKPSVLLLAAWMALAAALPRLVTWSAPVPDGPPLAALEPPEGWRVGEGKLNRFQGMLRFATSEIYDDSLLLQLEHPGLPPVEVQIFYCNSRRPRNRLTNTVNMINCLHGHFRDVEQHAAELRTPAPVPAELLHLRRDERSSALLYWLQSPGKTSADDFEHLLWLYRQDLMRRRTDGCFVKLAYYGKPDPRRDRALLELGAAGHDAVKKWLDKRQAGGY